MREAQTTIDMVKRRAFALALLPVALGACTAVAAPQAAVGDTSCDVALDYVATSPTFDAQFAAFLDGYLAGEKAASAREGADRDVAALMAKVIDYCKVQRNADFKSAVAAIAKD